MRKLVSLCALLLSVASVTAMAQPEEGLVVHYTFDEGAGQVVRDKSGNGLDGRIVHARRSGVSDKAEWVQEKNRKVLRFADWTHVEVGTKVNAMMGQSGTLETWCLPEEIRGGLISWHTGPNWPDARLVLGFVTYKDSRAIGAVADGVNSNGSSVREFVEKGKWAHLAMTFDGEDLRLFVNGEQGSTTVQRLSPNLQDVPLRIGLTDGLGHSYFVGRMAEVRVYDRALSAEEIARHFAAGVKRLGIEIPRSVGVTTRLDAKRGELTVLCDLARIPSLPGRPGLSVVLRDAKKNVLQEKTAPIPLKAGVVPIAFPTASLTTGLYEVSAAVKDMETDKLLGEPTIARWYLPEVAQLVGAPPGRKILNNLVTQLAVMDNLPTKAYQEVPFVNPRKGWVFVSTTADLSTSGLITVAVDAEKKDATIVHCTADKPTVETMRLLSAGEHKLRIWADSFSLYTPTRQRIPKITRLVVRAVPAMMFCGFCAGSHVAGYKDCNTFAFLARDVLPNINTLVGIAYPRWNPERAEWKRRGRRYLQEQGLPTLVRGVLKDVPSPLTGDYAYNYWTKSPGFTYVTMDGVVADEFGGGNSPDFLGYIEAVKRIAANPAFKDRAVHMWCGATMCLSALSRDFVGVVIDSGYKLATEVYLSEPPTVEEARAMFDVRIRREMEQWAKYFPGFPRHAIFVLGILSVPPESSNLNPHVDYKVFLDMQYQHLATSPECLGLWGVMVYKTTYAEEEALRWAGRLFRHYGIEGNTDLLSERYGFTYNLRHIRNADFNDGLTGWHVAAAEPESVTTGNMPRLHGLLGRYHGHKEGNDFLLMRRSAQKPNRVSQDIVGLEPGRFYSMKMIIADYQDLVHAKSEKKRLTVSVNIQNVEMIPEKSFVSDVRSGKPVAQYKGKKPPFMNYHRYVFRANGTTARLTISDWADPSTGSPRRRSGQAGQATPGGPAPAGQETLVNFIEIQPYLED